MKNAPRSFSIELNGEWVKYQLKPHRARKRISVAIVEGHVEARVPWDLSRAHYRAEVEVLLKKNAKKILAGLQCFPAVKTAKATDLPNSCGFAVELKGKRVPYQLKPHRNRKRMAIVVVPEGVEVRIPWTVSPERYRAKAEAMLIDYADWVLSKLKAHVTGPKKYEDGMRLLYRGEEALVRLGRDTDRVITNDGHFEICLKVSPGAAQEVIQGALWSFLQAQAVEVIHAALVRMRPLMRMQPKAWKISKSRKAWGGCTSQRVIRLAWRLIMLSDKEIDYIIAHELAHLVEFNHSPAFWREVEKTLPDWKIWHQKVRTRRMSTY